jgi:hypothetical protein
LLLVAKCAGDHNGEPRGMPPHSAPCCRSSAATSPLTYRSGVRPDYATFHILRVLSSDADTTVLPSGANLHAQRNIREHICDGRLRLSPAERGRHATLRKMHPPVALERLQALACARVPELHRPVPARTGEQPVNRPRHSQDPVTAIFLTCKFSCSTPLPR